MDRNSATPLKGKSVSLRHLRWVAQHRNEAGVAPVAFVAPSRPDEGSEPGPLGRYRRVEALCRARWPKTCPHCGGRRLAPRFDVPTWDCADCRRSFCPED